MSSYSVYNTYVNIWGEGEGRGRGTNGSISDVRYSDFQSTKAPSASKVPPPTHTQPKIGICIEIKYSLLWAGGGSTLLEIFELSTIYIFLLLPSLITMNI
jgi:hypothetical protein